MKVAKILAASPEVDRPAVVAHLDALARLSPAKRAAAVLLLAAGESWA